MTLNQNLFLQGSISVGCVLPAWKLFASVSVATTTWGRSTNVMKKFEQVSSDQHQMSLARGGGNPQMNKFEQVFSDHHQMSLAGGGSSGLMSRGMVEWRVPDLSCGGTLPCYLYHDAFDVTHPHPHEQTVACENITFPQTYLRAVNISEVLFTLKSNKMKCLMAHWLQFGFRKRSVWSGSLPSFWSVRKVLVMAANVVKSCNLEKQALITLVVSTSQRVFVCSLLCPCKESLLCQRFVYSWALKGWMRFPDCSSHNNKQRLVSIRLSWWRKGCSGVTMLSSFQGNTGISAAV